jgi:signal transduction histidine kinase
VSTILVGDKLRLRQVLINLFGNAIKFTERGSVNLTCSLQQFEGIDARILFSVKDTGVGIPSDLEDKLFHPFSQLDDGSTRRFGGTGLGLVISQNLIQLMGGLITVESRLGLGSCFSFELLLPVVTSFEFDSSKISSASTHSVANVELKAFSGINILEVEDDYTSGDHF